MEISLNNLISYITGIASQYPIKIGIDGVTASGKSTFSTKLKSSLEATGRAVRIISLDHFHNVREIRYREGRSSPEGYFRNAYNIEGIIKNVLEPLMDNEVFKYKEKIHDVESDKVLNSPWNTIGLETIILVEGSFSLRKELRSYFDCKIYLDVDLKTSENRGSLRDASLFGTEKEARRLIKERYHEAHKIHLQENEPSKHCNFLINNENPEHPKIFKIDAK